MKALQGGIATNLTMPVLAGRGVYSVGLAGARYLSSDRLESPQSLSKHESAWIDTPRLSRIVLKPDVRTGLFFTQSVLIPGCPQAIHAM